MERFIVRGAYDRCTDQAQRAGNIGTRSNKRAPQPQRSDDSAGRLVQTLHHSPGAHMITEEVPDCIFLFRFVAGENTGNGMMAGTAIPVFTDQENFMSPLNGTLFKNILHLHCYWKGNGVFLFKPLCFELMAPTNYQYVIDIQIIICRNEEIKDIV